MIVSATASESGPFAAATSSADAPRPTKKMIIMRRRPQRSPRRPAGSAPSPNMTKAPARSGRRAGEDVGDAHDGRVRDVVRQKLLDGGAERPRREPRLDQCE